MTLLDFAHWIDRGPLDGRGSIHELQPRRKVSR